MAAFESTYHTDTDLKAKWRESASCKDLPPAAAEAYINENSLGSSAAKENCGLCLVRRACLTAAVAEHDAQGNRGGFFFDGGRVTREDAHTIRAVFHLDPNTRQRSRRTKAQKESA